MSALKVISNRAILLDLKQEVLLREWQLVERLTRHDLAISGHGVRLGVHLDLGQRIVELHVSLAHLPAGLDGHHALGEAVLLLDIFAHGALADEGDGVGAHRLGARAILRPHEYRLGRRNGRVGVTHLSPHDVAALEHQFGLRAEERGAPQHKVCQLAHLDGAELVRHAVGDARVDCVLCHVAPRAEVVCACPRVFGQFAALHFVLVRGLPSPCDHFAHAAHGLRVGRDDGDRASVVQHVLRGDGLAANAALGKGHVLRNVLGEVVAHHKHVKVLIHCVDGEWPRGVGARRQHIRLAAHLDDVRRVATACALRVIRVNGAPLEGLDGALHAATLIERVGVDRHRHVVLLGD
mmetsp:Transcript_882/g.3441  ORF Transcript_882/g.3441 Transcript_882/m.3441 type:complete len:351 (+) Transcript_882:2270-3322(+)